MKGKMHLLIRVFEMVFLVILVARFQTLYPDIFTKIMAFIVPFNSPTPGNPIDALLILFGGVAFFFLGAILPDSDSEDNNSLIYHTYFFPMAFIVGIFEYPISKILKRDIGHRQSLHTFMGVFISSILLTSSIYLLYFLVSGDPFNILVPHIWFISLFFGQLLHLVEDWQFEFI